MPTDNIREIDHRLLRKIMKEVKQSMIKSGFCAGQWKFEHVQRKRAMKIYNN